MDELREETQVHLRYLLHPLMLLTINDKGYCLKNMQQTLSLIFHIADMTSKKFQIMSLHFPRFSIYKVEEFTMQFEEICRENYARIYNYILAKTGKREAAEDITQDVFLIAFQKGETFLRHEKPIAFLYTTARNLVLEYYKKDKAKEDELDETRMPAFGKDAYEELCLRKSDSIDEVRYQRQVFQQLQSEERDLYRKYYMEKRSMKAIAEELRMSEPAIRMKYMRIRRKVRKIVADLRLDDF